MTFQDFLMNSPSGGLMIKVGDGTPIGGLPPWIASDTVNGGLMFKVNGAGYTPPDGMLQTGTALNATLQVVNDNVGTNSALSLSTAKARLGSGSGIVEFANNANAININFISNNSGFGLRAGGAVDVYASATIVARFDKQSNGGSYIGEGTVTTNGAFTIKGSGSNILSLRDSSNVEKAYFSNDGTLNSGGGWADTIGYTSYLRNATLALYDGNTLTGITGSGGFVFNTKIMLGGTTSSFPAIKRNGAAIDFRLADDSAFCDLTANTVTIKTKLQVNDNAGGSGGFLITTATQQVSLVSNAYGTGSAVNVNSNGVIIQRGQTNVSANASSVLEVVSTTQGFLPPRMTTAQINAIATPANGLQVYNTDLNVICFYDGTGWHKVTHTNM